MNDLKSLTDIWPNPDLDVHAAILRRVVQNLHRMADFKWNDEFDIILNTADSLAALAHPIKVVYNDGK